MEAGQRKGQRQREGGGGQGLRRKARGGRVREEGGSVAANTAPKRPTS